LYTGGRTSICKTASSNCILSHSFTDLCMWYELGWKRCSCSRNIPNLRGSIMSLLEMEWCLGLL
jgi:hypothetical protein